MYWYNLSFKNLIPISHVIGKSEIQKIFGVQLGWWFIGAIRGRTLVFNKWTRKPPTKNGYYWVRAEEGDKPEIVRVTLQHADGSQSSLPVEIIADDRAYSLYDYRNMEWCPVND